MPLPKRATVGKTVRSLVDCLIAAVAIRHDVAVVHRDVDYEVIAAVTSLRARDVCTGSVP